MEIVIAAVLVALGLVVAATVVTKRAPTPVTANGRPKAAPPPAPSTTDDAKVSRDGEAGRLEQRLRAREEALDARVSELGERERRLAAAEGEIGVVRERMVRELERASGLSASQAKALLLKDLEDQVRHESARRLRAIEEETKRDAERRVRNILSVVMQRLAAGHAAETTVSVVQLQADDM
jgi:ribonuclease Y